MKATVKAQTGAKVEAQPSAQSEALNSMQAQLKAVETVKQLTLAEILQLPLKERVEALKQRSEALRVEAELKPVNSYSNFECNGLTGTDLISREIYVNSVKSEVTNTVNLWRKFSKEIEAPSFTRTFNTSLAKYIKNIKMNEANKGVKGYVRQVETIPYFDNINERINGRKGKTFESKRFKYFFEHLLNDKGIVGQNLTLYVETVNLVNVDVPFNSMNEILVYNESEADKSLEIFEAWLKFKGATVEQLNG